MGWVGWWAHGSACDNATMQALWGGGATTAAAQPAKRATRRRRRTHAMHLLVSCVRERRAATATRGAGKREHAAAERAAERVAPPPPPPEIVRENGPRCSVELAASVLYGETRAARCGAALCAVNGGTKGGSEHRDAVAFDGDGVTAAVRSDVLLMRYADDEDESAGELDGVDLSALDAMTATPRDVRSETLDALAAASLAHAPAREPVIRDDAPFTAALQLRCTWVEDARRHNVLLGRAAVKERATDIRRLAALYVPRLM